MVHPKDLGFGQLFEKIRDGVIVADAKTQRIVLWNSAATAIFGYSSSEALALRVEDLVPERYRAQHRAGIARYYATGRGRYIVANKPLDLPAVAKSGGEIRVELSLSPIGGEGGEEAAEGNGSSSSSYVLAIVRDITERNRAEKFAAQLLRHLSGEEMAASSDGPEALLPDISHEPRVALAEVQTVDLTPREQEALRWLALGKTNRQIAKRCWSAYRRSKLMWCASSRSSGSLTAHKQRYVPWNLGYSPSISIEHRIILEMAFGK